MAKDKQGLSVRGDWGGMGVWEGGGHGGRVWEGVQDGAWQDRGASAGRRGLGMQTILPRNECKGADIDLLATRAHQGVPSTQSLDQANVFLRAHGHHVKLGKVHAKGLIHKRESYLAGKLAASAAACTSMVRAMSAPVYVEKIHSPYKELTSGPSSLVGSLQQVSNQSACDILAAT
ncbi:MAG: hypothetical protein FRX49_11269 [Trebouxia sp. A1-2]|nr:MAG: hypothetical protein FRX49_11269 [Trebouxia sp. A1-2]